MANFVIKLDRDKDKESTKPVNYKINLDRDKDNFSVVADNPQKAINSFTTSVKTLNNNLSNFNSGKFSGSNVLESANQYQKEATSLLQQLENLKLILDPDKYEQLRTTLSGANTQLSNYEYYSKFKTADDYNKDITYQGYKSEFEGKSYTELENQNKYKTNNWKDKYFKANKIKNGEYKASNADEWLDMHLSSDEAIGQMTDEEIRRKIKEYETEGKAVAKEKTDSKVYLYGFDDSKGAFERRVQAQRALDIAPTAEKEIESKLGKLRLELKNREKIQKATGIQTEVKKNKDFETKSKYDKDFQVESKTENTRYHFINASEKEQAKMVASGYYTEQGYELMTDEQIKTYNSLVNSQNTDKANEYLDALNLKKLRNEKAVQEASKLSKDNSAWILATIPQALLGIGATVENTFNYLTTGEVDRYSSFNTALDVSNAVRGTVENKIDNKFLKLLYNAGTTAVDNLVSYYTGVGLGSPVVSQVIMSTSSAASTTASALDRGSSVENSLLSGAVAGVAEWFFEKYSIDAWDTFRATGKVGFKNWLKDFSKALSVEATSEIMTDISNLITDTMINGEYAEYVQMYNQYLDEGLSKDEALKKSAIEFGKQLGETALTTILSTGGMSAISTTSRQKQARQSGEFAFINNNQGFIIENAKAKNINTQKAQQAINELSGITDKFTSEQSEENKKAYDKAYKNAVSEIGSLTTQIVEKSTEQEADEFLKELQVSRNNENIQSEAPGEMPKQAVESKDQTTELGKQLFKQQYSSKYNELEQQPVNLNESTKQTMIDSYAPVTQLDTKRYAEAFTEAYEQGQANETPSKVEYLSDSQYQKAYEAGRQDISSNNELVYVKERTPEQQSINKLIKEKSNLDVVWFEQNSNVKVNGFISGDKIYINANSSAVPIVTAVHELMHSTEDSSVYDDIYKSVLNSKAYEKWLETKVKGKTHARREAKLANHINNLRKSVDGVNLTNEQQRQEIVAQYMADVLYKGDTATTVEYLNTILGAKNKASQPKVIEFLNKLVEKLKDFLATVTGKKEQRQLQKTIDLINQALGENANSKQTKYSVDKDDSSRYNKEKASEVTYSNDFRRIQESSRRLSVEYIKAVHSGSESVDDGIRKRLSRVFGREIINTSGLLWNGKTSIVNLKTNKNFNIIKNVDATLFHDIFEIVQKYLLSGDAVDLHSVEDYKNTKNYLSEDGLSGFSITRSGDLISVFNLGQRGFLKSASSFIMQEGAKTLDCFNSDMQDLPAVYSNIFGFKTASILEFNYDMLAEEKGKEYADYFVENYGKANVAFMVKTDEKIQTKHFNKNQYDEAVSYRDGFLRDNNKHFDNSDTRYSVDENIDNNVPFEEIKRQLEAGEITKEQAWDLMNEHGSIEEGEISTRDIKVPQSTKEGTYTRRFVRTVLESDSITDEMAEAVTDDIIADVHAYTKVSNDKAFDFAMSKIEDGRAEKIWNQTVSGELKVTKNTMVIGQVLLKEAANNNDKKKVLKMVTELSILGTEAGQAAQALSMLKRMGGVGELMYVKKFAERTQANLDNKLKDKAPKIVINEDLAEQVLNADNTTKKAPDSTAPIKEQVKTAKQENKKKTEAIDKLKEDVAKQVPATFLDKWNAWRYFSMLGNPRTQIRNLVGNAIFMPAIQIKKGYALALEQIFSSLDDKSMFKLKEDQKTQALKVDKKYKDFAKLDFVNVEKLLESGGKFNPEQEILQNRQIFKTKWLEFLRKFNFDMLEKVDAIFLKHHYVKALSSALQARKIDVNKASESQLQSARDYAFEQALKATYRDASVVANALNRLAKVNVATNILVEGILPFKKTPINVLKRGIEYSPAGLIKALSKGIYDVKKGNISTTEFIDGLASGLSGTSIMLVGMLLQNLGVISVGFGDDEEDWFKKLNGEQEYALQIGDKSYTLDWAAPSSIPFFIGAEISKSFKEQDSLKTMFTDAMLSSFESITNMSMLSGLNNTLTSIKYSKNPLMDSTVDIITDYFLQALPTVGGQGARIFDDKRKKNYYDKNSDVPLFVQSIVNSATSKTPGLANTKEPYVNAWGEEQKTGNFLERVFSNTISPGYSSTIKKDSVSDELNRLHKQIGMNVFPKTASKSITVKGENHYLSAKEHTTYQKEMGKTSRIGVESLIVSDEYLQAGDEDKAEMIKDVYSHANAMAKTVVTDYELSNQDQLISGFVDSGFTLGEVIAGFYVSKSSAYKEENLENINKSSIDEELKTAIYTYTENSGRKTFSDMTIEERIAYSIVHNK